MAFDVRRLDVYRKVPKDLTQPTVTGAIISICCCLFMAVLFFSELSVFLSTEITSELYVDGSANGEGKILVRLNITLHKLQCEFAGLDIQDDLGRHEVGFVETMDKHSLAPGGCRMEGRFYINKVPGNFHVSTHSADHQPDAVDMQHTIHEVTFGDEVTIVGLPGNYNALGGRQKLDSNEAETHDYILKVVPTIFEDFGGEKLGTYQYTYVSRHYTSVSFLGKNIPAIWFRYDLSPITVKYHKKRQPFYSFLTTVCAIVGGTFTVAGIIDACVFTASELLRKFELGKQS